MPELSGGMYIILCFTFKIGTRADNAWYQCTLSVPEIDPFLFVPHFEENFMS